MNKPSFTVKLSIVFASIAAAAVATAQVHSVECDRLTPQKFVEITASMADLQSTVTLAVAAQNLSTANGPGVVDIGPMLEPIRTRWSDQLLRPWFYDASTAADHPLKNFDLSVNKIFDPSRAYAPDLTGMAHYIASVTGAELTAALVYPRYWAGIAIFYNRAKSPEANIVSPSGKTTFNLQMEVHAKFETVLRKINAVNSDAVKCMANLNW
jgi:hypothetical protein